jgi:hypothetical protein
VYIVLAALDQEDIHAQNATSLQLDTAWFGHFLLELAHSTSLPCSAKILFGM